MKITDARRIAKEKYNAKVSILTSIYAYYIKLPNGIFGVSISTSRKQPSWEEAFEDLEKKIITKKISLKP